VYVKLKYLREFAPEEQKYLLTSSYVLDSAYKIILVRGVKI